MLSKGKVTTEELRRFPLAPPKRIDSFFLKGGILYDGKKTE